MFKPQRPPRPCDFLRERADAQQRRVLFYRSRLPPAGGNLPAAIRAGPGGPKSGAVSPAVAPLPSTAACVQVSHMAIGWPLPSRLARAASTGIPSSPLWGRTLGTACGARPHRAPCSRLVSYPCAIWQAPGLNLDAANLVPAGGSQHPHTAVASRGLLRPRFPAGWAILAGRTCRSP